LSRHPCLATALAGLASGARTLLDVGTGDGTVGASVAALLGSSIEGADKKPNPVAPFPVVRVDDEQLPFADASFDVVLLSDVLHHTRAPEKLLAEALRVADLAVVVKDHFAFGPWSERMLLALDVIGRTASTFTGVRTPELGSRLSTPERTSMSSSGRSLSTARQSE
jgi:SAM-dependent methyltransferase